MYDLAFKKINTFCQEESIYSIYAVDVLAGQRRKKEEEPDRREITSLSFFFRKRGPKRWTH